MIRLALLPAAALILSMAGCGGDDSEETDDTDGGTQSCTTAATLFPAANATGVYYRTTIEAKFAAIESDATIEVDGVTGTSAVRGNSIVFTPGSPLSPDTDYTATLHRACGDATWTFRTSDVGGAVGDVTGSSYALDLGSGRFIKPEGVASLLQQYLTTDVLIGVESVSGSNIQMVGAIGLEDADPPTQDPCAETIPFPAASFANPYFQVGPAETTINVQDISITIDDLLISGSFTPDGNSITGAVLSGSIDTRPLDPLLGDGEEGAICSMASAAGISCEPCPDGTNFCLSVLVDSIEAAKVTGAITPQTKEEACAREECAAESSCVAPQ